MRNNTLIGLRVRNTFASSPLFSIANSYQNGFFNCSFSKMLSSIQVLSFSRNQYRNCDFSSIYSKNPILEMINYENEYINRVFNSPFNDFVSTEFYSCYFRSITIPSGSLFSCSSISLYFDQCKFENIVSHQASCFNISFSDFSLYNSSFLNLVAQTNVPSFAVFMSMNNSCTISNCSSTSKSTPILDVFNSSFKISHINVELNEVIYSNVFQFTDCFSLKVLESSFSFSESINKSVLYIYNTLDVSIGQLSISNVSISPIEIFMSNVILNDICISNSDNNISIFTLDKESVVYSKNIYHGSHCLFSIIMPSPTITPKKVSAMNTITSLIFAVFYIGAFSTMIVFVFGKIGSAENPMYGENPDLQEEEDFSDFV